jgi:hypothetical protein
MMDAESQGGPTVIGATSVDQPNRKPMNAFLLFCKRHRALVKELYPNLENRNITKILGEWWSNLNPDEKEPFNTLAVTYKEHLMREQPSAKWRKQPAIQRLLPPDQQPPTLDSNAYVAAATVTPGESESQRAEVSRGSSGSSSPEPGASGGSSSTSAPKPFKKRYLAAEKAKLGAPESSETKNACEALLQLAEGGGNSVVTFGDTPSGPQSGTCSPTNGASNSSSSSSSVKGNPYDNVKESAQFSVLRDAVWTRVAKTLLTQDKEKGNDAHSNNGDKPINLSSQCTIRGQTIIEHIIENILNDNGDETEAPKSTDNNNANGGGSESTEQIKEKIYQSLKEDIMRRTTASGGAKDGSNDLTALWKMLPNPTAGIENGASAKAVSISALGLSKMLPSQLPALKATKEPERAKSAPASQSGSGVPSPKSNSEPSFNPKTTTPVSSEPSVSVTLVTEPCSDDLPLNLSTTPPQTPAGAGAKNGNGSGVAITITTSSPAKRKLLDDDDDDIRRSSRACKGRRYQEFKDAVGRKGRRIGGRSDGDTSQQSEDEQQPLLATTEYSSPSKQFVTQFMVSEAVAPSQDARFDLEKALTAIPALRPEEFQKRIQTNRQLQRAPTASASIATVVSPSGRLSDMDSPLSGTHHINHQHVPTVANNRRGKSPRQRMPSGSNLRS